MGSRDKRGSAQAHHKLKMDAIKKKMQAMKVEKDNACDRSDQCEEASKAAKIRAEKAEDEVAELNAKARQLETELDLCTEKLAIVSLQLEEKEKSLMAAEAEMNAPDTGRIDRLLHHSSGKPGQISTGRSDITTRPEEERQSDQHSGG